MELVIYPESYKDARSAKNKILFTRPLTNYSYEKHHAAVQTVVIQDVVCFATDP